MKASKKWILKKDLTFSVNMIRKIENNAVI